MPVYQAAMESVGPFIKRKVIQVLTQKIPRETAPLNPSMRGLAKELYREIRYPVLGRRVRQMNATDLF